MTAPPARRTETWATRPAGRTVSIGCSTLSGMALVLFYFYCILFFFGGGGCREKGDKIVQTFSVDMNIKSNISKKNHLPTYIFKEIGTCRYRLFVIFRFTLNRYYMYKLL